MTLDQADADMKAVSRAVIEIDPGSEGWDVLLFNLQDFTVRDVRKMLYVLLGAVALVLLIACANVANLLLVRGAARRKELAIRSAIGASRGRLLHQLLIEQLALSAISASAGVLIAAWLLRLVLTIIPSALPRQESIGIDGRVLGFALLLSILTPLLFGLLPALHASRPDPGSILRLGRAVGSGRARPPSANGRRHGRDCAGHAAAGRRRPAGAELRPARRRLARLRSPRGPCSPASACPPTSILRASRGSGSSRDFLRRIEALGPVAAAGIAMPMPMVNDFNSGFEIEGQPVPPEGKPLTLFYAVSEGYFEAMGIPLIRGRLPGAGDVRGGTRIIVVNQAIADTVLQGLGSDRAADEGRTGR